MTGIEPAYPGSQPGAYTTRPHPPYVYYHILKVIHTVPPDGFEPSIPALWERCFGPLSYGGKTIEYTLQKIMDTDDTEYAAYGYDRPLPHTLFHDRSLDQVFP